MKCDRCSGKGRNVVLDDYGVALSVCDHCDGRGRVVGAERLRQALQSITKAKTLDEAKALAEAATK